MTEDPEKGQRIDVTYNRKVAYAKDVTFTMGLTMQFSVVGEEDLDRAFDFVESVVERRIAKRMKELGVQDGVERSAEYWRKKVVGVSPP